MDYLIKDVCTSKVKSQPVRRAFTLIEVLASLIIIALIASSVFVVIDRCLIITGDMRLRMSAFKIARENMEQILSSGFVEQMVEYGTSDEVPGISYENVVEVFTEPINSQIWARAVCSAEYTDYQGQEQTIELEQWLTDLSKQQLAQLALMEGFSILDFQPDQLLEDVEQAAEYAGVDADTILDWVSKGLRTTDEGQLLKYNIDIFTRAQGQPTPQELQMQVNSVDELKSDQDSEQGPKTEYDQYSDEDQRPADDLTIPSTGQPEEIDIEELKKMLR